MVLGLDEVEDENGAASILGWITAFEPGEMEFARGSRPSTRCSIVGCSSSGATSGVLSFEAGC